jgi:hypothetical protein
MEASEIKLFISFKNKSEYQKLPDDILDLFSELFDSSAKRNKKYIKKSTNILKNQKIQNKKDIMSNKVNLILNKLTESNIDNLVIEFLETINQVDEENFEDIQKTFYFKMLSEINFAKIYIQFLKLLSFVYYQVQKYNLSFFISIIETKFKYDYTDYDINPGSKYDFIKELDGETKRTNNLIIIKNLVDHKIFSDNIIKECDNTIINQKVYLPDIYHWFNNKDRLLNPDEINKVKLMLKKDGITSREIVLLENLINKKLIISSTNQNNETKTTSHNSQLKSVSDNNSGFNLECGNIIEEYLLVKSLDDVQYFIEKKCADANNKNKFCENLIDQYFIGNKESSNDVLELIKLIIKEQLIFKSNLSRGLLLINSNWKDKSIDYYKPKEKMKTLLSFLKNNGITKGLEKLMDSFI